MKTSYSFRKSLQASTAILPALLLLGQPAFAQTVTPPASNEQAFEIIDFLDFDASNINSSFTALSADGNTFIISVSEPGTRNVNAAIGAGALRAVVGLGSLGGSTTYATSISSNGTVVVGNSSQLNGASRAFRWVGGVMTSLDDRTILEKGEGSVANDVSADGSVVVGQVFVSGGSNAFRWIDGAMSNLGTLGGTDGEALAVSADGSAVTGYATNAAGNFRAFRWSGGVMTGLGTLGGNNSYGVAISADNSTVVGNSEYAGGAGLQHAFRWVDGEMADLGTLGGFGSSARYVSADGSVVAGTSGTSKGGDAAFRWKDNKISGLGELGGRTATDVTGMSDDGSVLVGQIRALEQSGSRTLSEEGPQQQPVAYRWNEASGLQTIGEWVSENDGKTPLGYRMVNALDVSADGSVVIGVGQYDKIGMGDGPSLERTISLMGPTQTYWLARGNSFLSDTAAFDRSVLEAGRSSTQTALSATNLALEGAHHRTLRDMGLTVGPNGWFVWSTADAAKNDYTDTSTVLVETGVGRDFGEYRIGVALGTTRSRQDWDLGGNAEFNGDYILAEISRSFALAGGGSLEASLLGYHASFDTTLNRAYASGGGTDISTGNPDLKASAFKARLDWVNASTFGNVSMSPYAALTMSNAKVDGYTETGGAFPATYGASSSDAGDLRIGSAFSFETADMVKVRIGAEAVHQFQSDGRAVNGGVTGLYSFNLTAEERKSNWARVTVDADYALSATSTLTGGVSMSTQGSQPTIGVTFGLRSSF